MEAIAELRKKYCSRAMFLAIAVALILVLAGEKGLAKGLILGSLFSVINFVLMGETLRYRLGPSRGRNTLIALVMILLRFALLAVPLIIAVYSEQIHIVTSIAGIFMVQLAMLLELVKGFVLSKLSLNTTGK